MIKAGNILCIPSPARVHNVDIVITFEMAQPRNKAKIVETIQAVPAAVETGRVTPNPSGRKKAMANKGMPLNSIGTNLNEIKRAYQIK